ncbi:MAG TPA: glycosyltransferase family 9 protein [Vicinamibacteria bacterium]|nr:glycosyltransferase family 9 protein [Vicinamibacteria bacterium]
MTLLAPAASGSALVGGGAGEARRLVDWERADALFAEGASLRGPLRRDLAGHVVALAFTRTPALVASLHALLPRVLERDPSPPPGTHAARWLAGLVEPLGLDPTGAPPACSPSPDEEREARAWRDRLPPRFLALHPGSGSPRKSWPAERFLGLVDRLRPPEPWLVPCGPADRAAVAPFRTRAGALVAEDVPVRVLGALLAEAGAFVGNDSGVSHLAAAWGAPTVALFGPTDAATWAPEGTRVRTVQSATGEMATITADEVARAVETMGPWAT